MIEVAGNVPSGPGPNGDSTGTRVKGRRRPGTGSAAPNGHAVRILVERCHASVRRARPNAA